MNDAQRSAPDAPAGPAAGDDKAARRRVWATAHADALRAQDDRIERHGHPFGNVMVGPFHQ